MHSIQTDLHKTKQRLEKQVRSCEIIAEMKNRKANYGKQGQVEKSNVDSWYFEIKSEIEILEQKLTTLTDHNSTILDKFEVLLDENSNEIYFGAEDQILIDCEAYELFINSKKYVVNSTNRYIIPNSNFLQLEYLKYFYNYKANKIDTVISRRELHLKKVR